MLPVFCTIERHTTPFQQANVLALPARRFTAQASICRGVSRVRCTRSPRALLQPALIGLRKQGRENCSIQGGYFLVHHTPSNRTMNNCQTLQAYSSYIFGGQYRKSDRVLPCKSTGLKKTFVSWFYSFRKMRANGLALLASARTVTGCTRFGVHANLIRTFARARRALVQRTRCCAAAIVRLDNKDNIIIFYGVRICGAIQLFTALRTPYTIPDI